MKPTIATPTALQVDVNSRACRIAITIATNCQIDAIEKIKIPMPGINPNTFNTPGDCANPKVRANCPQFASVSAVLNIVVPIR